MPPASTPAMAHPPTVPQTAAQEEPDEEEDGKGLMSWALRSPARAQRGRPPTCPPSAAQGTPRAGNPGATSPICSTACRRTRSCGLTPARRSGRDPAAGTSSTSREKYSVPAACRVGCSRTGLCSAARSHLAALAIVGLRRAGWCVHAARAMRTVCCSWRYYERSRQRVVDFPWERDTFGNKIMEIVKDFDEKKLQQQR